MYTGKELFDMAIGIIASLSDIGTVTMDETSDYFYRAPYLLDAWQKEMTDSGSLYNVEEYANEDSSNVYKWTKFNLPAGMKSIKDMLFTDSKSQIKPLKYRTFGNIEIYFYFTCTGTAKLLFIPTPEKISKENWQTYEIKVDDTTAMSGAYYLAEQFCVPDGETEIATVCRKKFEDIKRQLSKPVPLSPEEIIDVYDFGNE